MMEFAFEKVKNIVAKGENAVYKDFPIFSSTGRRPPSLCHSLLTIVRAFVHLLTFSLNISETTYLILMKFHRNVPAMVLIRILERI